MVKNAYEVCLRRNTRSSAAKLEEAKQELQESYDREQEKYVNEKIHAITDAIIEDTLLKPVRSTTQCHNKTNCSHNT